MANDLFLMKCLEDQSFVIAPKEDVVFRGAVHHGTKVKFFYRNESGRKKRYTGVVEETAARDDFARLAKVQDQLIRKAKLDSITSESSSLINGGRTRQSTSSSSKRKNPSADSDLNPKKVLVDAGPRQNSQGAFKSKLPTPETGTQAKCSTYFRSSVSPDFLGVTEDEPDSLFDGGESHPESFDRVCSSSESEDDNSLTPEEKLFYLKIKEKKKRLDLRKLSDLQNREKHDDLSDLENAGGSRNWQISESKSYDLDLDNPKTPHLKPLISSIHRSRKPETCQAYTGDMYRFSSDDDNVQELIPNTQVFLLKQDYENIKSSANSASSLARQLMKAIFTKEALGDCSLGGNIAFGQGRLSDVSETRPALDSRGVDAIFNYAKVRQKRKVDMRKWKEMDDSTIKTRMRNLLCEIRFKSKRQLFSAANTGQS